MFGHLLSWIETRIKPFSQFGEQTVPPPELLAFSLFYLKPARVWLFVLLVSSCLVAIVESGLILLIGWLVDVLASQDVDRLWSDRGLQLVAVGAALLLLRPVNALVNEVLANQTTAPPLTIQVGWRAHVYTIQHAIADFQSELTGRIADRVVQVGPALRTVTMQALDAGAYAAVYVGVTLLAFAAVNFWLAIPLVAWLVTIALIVRWFMPRMGERAKLAAQAHSGLIGALVDTYTNILTVKLFSGAEFERSSVRSAMEQALSTLQRSLRLHSAQAAILTLVNTILLVGVAAIAVALWSRGQVTIGEVSAGLALVARLLGISTWVVQTVRIFVEQLGMVQNSMTTIARPHALVDGPNAIDLDVKSGDLEFRNVNFHYCEGISVISDVNLRVHPGEKIALIGPSGAGKSTLIALLLRLHQCSSGQILIDGQDIAAVTHDSLTRQIGVVSQDVSLLNRSVWDNIAYGNPQAPADKIREALRLAQVDEFLPSLLDPEGRRGSDACVGEHGTRLSAGQRQRIAIARMIVRNSPIVVLDEATSALDFEAESAIKRNCEAFFRGKTVIAITHRMSTIVSFDRAAIIKRGRIAEIVNAAELKDWGGLY